MNKNDSTKVLTHIDEAKNWLDEAKEEYTQSNHVRGELNLNLAQAEVKYAWELSRQQDVIPSIQTASPSTRRAGKYFLPAAAACFLILGFAGGFYWLNHNGQSEIPILTAKNKNIPVKQVEQKQEIPVAKAIEKPVLEHETADLTVHPNPAQPEKVAPISSTRPTNGISGRKIVKAEGIKSTPTTAPQKASHLPVAAVAKSAQDSVADNNEKMVTPENPQVTNATPSEREFVPNVSKLSMASLVIDEEALTKEASYSLKNGK